MKDHLRLIACFKCAIDRRTASVSQLVVSIQLHTIDRTSKIPSETTHLQRDNPRSYAKDVPGVGPISR